MKHEKMWQAKAARKVMCTSLAYFLNVFVSIFLKYLLIHLTINMPTSFRSLFSLITFLSVFGFLFATSKWGSMLATAHTALTLAAVGIISVTLFFIFKA